MNKILKSFPVAGISTLPTPVSPLLTLGKKAGHANLFIKQDNLSGAIYGGNKIRKLEFLLGEALAAGHKSIITYGAVGSNHALATAIYCQQLGLHAIAILTPQQTNPHVQKNILMHHTSGTELHFVETYAQLPEITEKISTQRKSIDGIAPYIIPPGGTNTIGALGFVNAALELSKQIQPDVIYIPMGTGGTLAGLLVGLKIAGLSTRIEAIRVVDATFRNETHIQALCDKLFKKLIHPKDAKPLSINKSDIHIRNEFFGDGYGIPTAAGREAVKTFKTLEKISLETTYTGKCTAALLHDLNVGSLANQTVLYWNTLDSHDFSAQTNSIDWRALPAPVHPYF